MDCLENIIGFTSTDCPCFEEDFNEAAKISKSGLYMDQLPESISMSAYNSITGYCTDMQDLFTNARNNGILQFKELLGRELGKLYSVRMNSYNGKLGSTSGNGYLTIPEGYAGVAIDILTEESNVTLNKLVTYFSDNTPVEIHLYSAVKTKQGYTDLEFIKSFMSNDFTPLSLSTENTPSYIFMYEVPVGVEPGNNSSSCGCGSERDLKQYIKISGVIGTGLGVITETTNRINGLLFYADASCGNFDFLCKNYNNNEFIREAVNWAVLRKSVSALLIAFLNSDAINRYTMQDRERIGYNVNILNSMAMKSISWVADNLNLSGSKCYVCNPSASGSQYNYQKGGILL